ncbi:MAG: sulfatase [Haloarculaceae archaeon]
MSPSGRTNVLFVVLDTVRKDHLTPYGYEEPTTPTLASFAEDAAVFENAVAPAPWTLPVHASMFTGEYPSVHGATQESPYLEGSTTLATALSAAGYATSCYSSNAWITPYTHLTDGFDDSDNFFKAMPGDLLSGPLAKAWKTMNDSDRLRTLADRIVALGNAVHERLAAGGGEDSKTPAVVDRTIDFIDDAEGAEAPFFSFINLMDAHLPYHPPEDLAEQFAPGVDSTDVCQNSKAYNCGAVDVDGAEWTAIRGLYDAEVRHMDDHLGRLFDWLRAEGRYEDTTIVVAADHGELHGEHDFYGHEFNVYDPLVNVPLMVKHPDVEPGRREETVELIDLYHTILDVTGVEAAGRPLDPDRSMLSNSYREGDLGEYGFVEYHRPIVELNQLESIAADAGIDLDEEDSQFYSRMRAARRSDGKYIRNERIDDEAYRIDHDPGETEPVGTDDEVIGAVAGALQTFEDRVGGAWLEGSDDPLADMDAATKDRLRQLGYVE